MEMEILSVVVAALLGAFISFVSFSYKSRLEVKAKVNSAIFHLLEVWSFVGMSKALYSKEFSIVFIDRLRAKFPDDPINEDAESSIAQAMEVAIPTILESFFGDKNYLAKYSEAVNALAPVYPLLAYRLNKNQSIINFLNCLDSLMEGAADSPSEADTLMMKSIKEFANQDAFDEFEKDIKGLAKRVSYFKSRELCDFVDDLKTRVDKIPGSAFDTYIDSVFVPVVEELKKRQQSCSDGQAVA